MRFEMKILIVALIDDNKECIRYQKMNAKTYKGMIGRVNSWFVSCK